MAKKETKKKEKQEKKSKNKANASVPNAAGQPVGAAPNAAAGAAGAAASINNTQLDRSQMTADQMTQAQIEEAIKESQDPSSRLKKLRSPLSIRGCLLNLLILVVLTVGIVLLCCYFMLDKETFNLGVVVKDILDKFKITKFFKMIGNWFKRVFT